jgi:hypothetical protein
MSVRTDKPPWASLQPPGVVQNQDEDLQRLAPPGMDSAVPSATHTMVLHPPFLLAEPADCAGPQRPGSRPLSAQLLATARSSASRSGNLSAATSSLVTLMATVSGQFRPPSAGMSPGSRPTSALSVSPGAVPQESRPTSAKGGIDAGGSLNNTLSQRSSANTTPRNRVHPEPVVLPVEELQAQPSATEAWPSRVPTRSGHEEREPLSLPPEAGEASRPPSAATERVSIGDVARRGARSPAKLLEHTSD